MRVLAVVSLLALAACNPEPTVYPPGYERNFVVACEQQGSSNALCTCVWDRVEANITPGDFDALERLPGPEREVHPLTAQINGYVEACNVSLNPPATDVEEPVPAP